MGHKISAWCLTSLQVETFVAIKLTKMCLILHLCVKIKHSKSQGDY